MVRKDNTFVNKLFTDIFIVHSFQEFTILNFNDLLTAIPVDPRSAIDFKGGESIAIDRLNHYLWQTDSVATYKETRNGMIGADYSTKFSSW